VDADPVSLKESFCFGGGGETNNLCSCFQRKTIPTFDGGIRVERFEGIHVPSKNVSDRTVGASLTA
jgi:hypothetical protein